MLNPHERGLDCNSFSTHLSSEKTERTNGDTSIHRFRPSVKGIACQTLGNERKAVFRKKIEISVSDASLSWSRTPIVGEVVEGGGQTKPPSKK
ncbi:MAG TPA: hypothetical protein VJK50_01940 [Patescibacteria group bacterium]|nr:hypothetical protein [Patescibacteria group bacterium]